MRDRHQALGAACPLSPTRETGRPALEGLSPARLLWPGVPAPGLCPLLQGARSPHHGGRAPGRVQALTQQPRGAGVHDAILGGLEDGLRQGDGVAHHGPVEAVLRHDAAPAPALLSLPPLGSSVLEPDLYVQTNRSGASSTRQRGQAPTLLCLPGVKGPASLTANGPIPL